MTSLRLLDYSIVRAAQLYNHSDKIEIEVRYNDRCLKMRAAVVHPDDLADIMEGERYAGVLGEEYFITENVPEQYRHIVALHEMVERTGAGHEQSTVSELQYAEAVLTTAQYQEYLEWRSSLSEICDQKPAESLDDVFDRLVKHHLFF
ncbi:MAG: hypothetical protein V1729_06490 [Candidatus Woesearchaeota archaeon]